MSSANSFNLNQAESLSFGMELSAWGRVNHLPYDKILVWSKLKAFADENINATQKLKYIFCRIENIAGNGENAPLPTMFSKAFFIRVVESRDCVVKG